MLSHFSYTCVLAKVDIASDSLLSMKYFNLYFRLLHASVSLFFINTYTSPLL